MLKSVAQVCPPMSFVALLLVGSLVQSLSGADRSVFSLVTKTITLDYSVSKDGVLTYDLKRNGGTDAFHLNGRVFPDQSSTVPGGNQFSQPVLVAADGGTHGLAVVYQSHSITQESANIKHATVIVKDPHYPLRIERHIRAYKAESIFEQWTTLCNDGDKTIIIPRLDSWFFQSSVAGGAFLEWFSSNEGSEASQPTREKLAKGCRRLTSQDGNRHVAGSEPFFSLGFGAFPAEEQGACLVAALTWSGSMQMSFELNEANLLGVFCGVNQPTPVPVAAGKSLTTPTCVYTFSTAGKGPASRNFHRWMRTYGLRDGTRPRLVDNNSWEGCQMNVTEPAVIEMMQLSAALGIELYVMDDGWFGNEANARTNDDAGLGDWQLNRQRFPNGLDPLIKAGKESNIAFGIWFEPEMVNPKSRLFAQHPEWVMRVPGKEFTYRRNQLVLDVANPAVQDFMFKSVNDILAAYPGIRFVKWDCNSSITNPYSPFLGPECQGEMVNRYMDGYYRTVAKLNTAYPAIDFQACAAGGGRADLGAMRNSHTFWPSDNTDPSHRLGAIWNFTTCIPALAATGHVTHAGSYSAKYRFDVAMLGQLGMEVDPRKSPPDYLAAARVGIAAYKGIRDIVQFGDQYRHQHPFDSTTPSLNYVSADLTRAVVLAYQLGDIKEPLACTSPVSGLDPKRSYRITEINLPPHDDQARVITATQAIQTGAEWMTHGIPLVFTRRFDSAAVTLNEVTER